MPLPGYIGDCFHGPPGRGIRSSGALPQWLNRRLGYINSPHLPRILITPSQHSLSRTMPPPDHSSYGIGSSARISQTNSSACIFARPCSCPRAMQPLYQTHTVFQHPRNSQNDTPASPVSNHHDQDGSKDGRSTHVSHAQAPCRYLVESIRCWYVIVSIHHWWMRRVDCSGTTNVFGSSMQARAEWQEDLSMAAHRRNLESIRDLH